MNYITQEELSKKKHVLVVDVRNPDEYSKRRIEGSVNIPFAVLLFSLDSLPKDSLIVTVCEHGERRSVKAQKLLEERGFRAKYLKGGIKSLKLK